MFPIILFLHTLWPRETIKPPFYRTNRGQCSIKYRGRHYSPCLPGFKRKWTEALISIQIDGVFIFVFLFFLKIHLNPCIPSTVWIIDFAVSFYLISNLYFHFTLSVLFPPFWFTSFKLWWGFIISLTRVSYLTSNKIKKQCIYCICNVLCLRINKIKNQINTVLSRRH